MSHFCENCGRPLVEGETCHCTMENVKYQDNDMNVTLPKENIKKKEVVVEKTVTNTANTNTNSIDFKEHTDSIFTALKGIIKKPVETVKTFASNKSFVPGLIILAVVILIKCIVNEADLIHDVALGYYKYSGGVGITSYFNTFFTTLIYSAIQYGLIIGAVYLLINKVFKTDIKLEKVINIFAIATLGMMASYVVTLLFTIIDGTIVNLIVNHIAKDFGLGLRNILGYINSYVHEFAYIIQVTLLFLGIKETTEVDKNKLLLVVPSALIIAGCVIDILKYVFR